jgi:hypothetical protein
MKPNSAITWLVPLVGLLALAASSAGLLWSGGPGPSTFTTVHGQTVELFGQGLYRSDALFFAATFKGIDVVTLAVFLPALGTAYWLYQRGSLPGSFLLTGMLAVFLYNGASMAFSAAYNPIFLVYVALLATSFFAFVLIFGSIDHQVVAGQVSSRLPRRGLVIFLCLAGLAPLVLWLSDILGALATGRVPQLLGSYTTMYTYAIDLAIVVPSVYLAAFLLLRRAPVGYLLATVMLILLASVGAGVIAATAVQLSVGITFSPGQFVGLIGSWIVLGLLAIYFTAELLRSLPKQDALPPVTASQRGSATSGTTPLRRTQHQRSNP